MEKFKFGMQLLILLLAFPLWFITEIQKADSIAKKGRVDNFEIMDTKKITVHDKQKKELGCLESSAISFSKFIVSNN